MSDYVRSLVILWEPGEDPVFDHDGWAAWELDAIFKRCLEILDPEFEEVVEE